MNFFLVARRDEGIYHKEHKDHKEGEGEFSARKNALLGDVQDVIFRSVEASPFMIPTDDMHSMTYTNK